MGACYAMVEIGDNGVAVEFRSVEYPLEVAARAILDSTLPSDLADYVRTGGKPVSNPA